MNDTRDTTKYVVRVTVDSAEAAGQVAAAAAGEGFTEIRYDALEHGERRPLTKDELGVTLQVVARATDERRGRNTVDDVVRGVPPIPGQTGRRLTAARWPARGDTINIDGKPYHVVDASPTADGHGVHLDVEPGDR